MKTAKPFKPGTLVMFLKSFSPSSSPANKIGDLALVIGRSRLAYGSGYRYELLFDGKVFGCDDAFLELAQGI